MADPKITARCPSCKFNLTLGSANTVLIWVKHHEYMSYLHCECSRPQCAHTWFTFLNADSPAEARRMVRLIQKSSSWEVRIQDPTPQRTIDDYEEAAEIHLLKQLEVEDIEPSIRRRQDRIVATLAWELETATVQDILDTDIDTRTPRMWVT